MVRRSAADRLGADRRPGGSNRGDHRAHRLQPERERAEQLGARVRAAKAGLAAADRALARAHRQAAMVGDDLDEARRVRFDLDAAMLTEDEGRVAPIG